VNVGQQPDLFLAMNGVRTLGKSLTLIAWKFRT